MEFISEVTFDVKLGKTRDFQEWSRKNEDTIRKETPRRWEYIGTYAVIFSTEPGQFRQLWRHDSYGAMDTFAEAMGKGGRSPS